MDLAYMPGELDYKNTKKGDPSSDIKREHDSVDDFEHLDPELSPSVDVQSKEFSGIEKFVAERDNQYEKLSDKDLIVTKPLIPDLSKDEPCTFNKPPESLTGNNSGSKDIMTDFESGSHIDSNFGVSNQEEPSLLDFVKDGPTISDKNHEVDLKNKSSFPAEKATDINKTEHESDLLNIESKAKDSAKNPQGIHSDDGNLKFTGENSVPVNKEMDFDGLAKSMKEADALSHYDMKPDRKGITKKDDLTTNEEYEPEPFHETHDPEPVIKTLPELTKPEPPVDITKPEKFESKPDPVKHNEQEKPKDEPVEIEDPLEVFIAICPSKPTSTASDLEENPLKEFIAICPSKPTSAVSDSVAEKNIKKMSVSDLDDIIGPEDVFKRIGLVEALVYWRDPKKSGVVFGGAMAILLSLCYMSLISVVAYSSLLALTGTICFRIYKNILQAVQKTSEGHPFKEFLDLELSLPQDKVREMADTAVVHVNAAIVELRRLFLVEDLIDSIKFGVCLWCLTYVGAIFNGMTLVILAFVALFTVPKVYENNKASIDTYIEMGRSRVAEITSKVKAAVPIGKKEPEKDKEQ